jgi:hypothetical protein
MRAGLSPTFVYLPEVLKVKVRKEDEGIPAGQCRLLQDFDKHTSVLPVYALFSRQIEFQLYTPAQILTTYRFPNMGLAIRRSGRGGAPFLFKETGRCRLLNVHLRMCGAIYRRTLHTSMVSCLGTGHLFLVGEFLNPSVCIPFTILITFLLLSLYFNVI